MTTSGGSQSRTEMVEHVSAREFTAQLVDFICGTAQPAIPEAVWDLARRSLIDTVGVAIAARNEDAVRIAREVFDRGSVRKPAVLWFDGSVADAATAALLNSIAAHALDLDDVSDVLYGHPSAVLWPALLAASAGLGVDGERLMRAYVIGYSVDAAVASTVGIRDHYSRGWHSSATVGLIGATAAVAVLMGLDAAQARAALGIASSMTSGSRANFGTMTKPLHLGLAARNAVHAVELASRGFTSNPNQLDADLGYFAMYGVADDYQAGSDSLGGPWALGRHGLNVKRYASCYNTHRAIDAALEISSRSGFISADIRSIRVTVEPGGLDPLSQERPATGLAGKFSMEYAVAAALLDGSVGLGTFTDAAVNRKSIARLMDRTEVVMSDSPPAGPPVWDFAYAIVDVDASHARHVVRADVPKGNTRFPLSEAELASKFDDCIAYSRSGWDADRLFVALSKVREQTSLHVARALGGEASVAGPEGPAAGERVRPVG